MPKTNAERQQAWRQRRTGRIAAVETEAAQLRAEDDALRADLDAALAEIERLSAAQCKHPSAASTATSAAHAARTYGESGQAGARPPPGHPPRRSVTNPPKHPCS
jgi:hypothetical protein